MILFRALIVAVLTIALFVLSFPPFDLPEAAYVFLFPFVFWAWFSPPWKWFLGTAVISACLSWLILLIWLRHVTVPGLLILSSILGLFFVAWLALLRWMMPGIEKKSLLERLIIFSGLSAFWVLMEGLRSVLFSGFPWLPLAASQWERLTMLQILSWTGAWGLSFLLIFFNLTLAYYVGYIIRRREFGLNRRGIMRHFCPELYIALALLAACFCLLLYEVMGRGVREPVMKVGIIQPSIAAVEKWDRAHMRDIIGILERQTDFVNTLGADLVLWPETATPSAILGDSGMKTWVERLAFKNRFPIVTGSMVEEDNLGYNSMHVVDPVSGVSKEYYAKRHLVPYGEYIPLERYLPFLRKIVPLEGAFSEGDSAYPLVVEINDKEWKLGPMICFEDIFPGLARDTVNAGADLLLVITNNAWFGEEGAAYQHAAHSVLRAVELRRPVIRCGNSGWSGWIDEYGHIREVMTNEEGSIYFRGSTVYEVTRDKKWAGKKSFYAIYGDWFLIPCLLLFVLSVIRQKACEKK